MGLPAIATAERSYSLSRVAHAQVTNDWTQAGLELEVSQELKDQIGRSASGIYVPIVALAGRALVTTATAPSLIGTQQMHDAFVEVLKPQVRVMELGATVLPGLGRKRVRLAPDGRVFRRMDYGKQRSGGILAWFRRCDAGAGFGARHRATPV